MREIYLKLREQMDQYLDGFPATASGVEIRILEKLFTEEEAWLYLHLGIALENPSAIAGRLGRDAKDVKRLLDRMAEKGLIFRIGKGEGEPLVAAAAFCFGIFEYQLKCMDRELAGLVETYFEEGFLRQMSKTPSMVRTVPIHRSIDVSWTVAPYDDAREIIRSQEKIALADCICRVKQGHIDSACDKPIEVCFYFGSNATYFVEKKMGRWISREEALAIQAACEEHGLITQPDNSRKPTVMCHCCGDCCVMLRAVKKHPRPAENVNSNHSSEVDASLCEGCGICSGRCWMEAITIGPEQTARVNYDRCIGCGLCVATCPAGALSLRQKPKEQRTGAPMKPRDRMIRLAKQREKTLTPLAYAEK